jgi:hypothetical protein
LIDSSDTRDRLARAKPDATVFFDPQGRHYPPGRGAAVFLRRP